MQTMSKSIAYHGCKNETTLRTWLRMTWHTVTCCPKKHGLFFGEKQINFSTTCLKGHWTIFWNFLFWFNFIYQVNIDYSLTNTKRKLYSKIPSKSEEIINFCKACIKWAWGYCIYVTFQNMVILNQNVIICMMFTYLTYLFKELHKQASEFSSRVE